MPKNNTFPKTADIVIIGGGVMGASIAYHLAKSGLNNVILLEKEKFFGQGATGRCAGGVRYQFATKINIQLSKLSLPMLERFKDEIGQAIDFRHCGYLFMLNQQKDIENFKKVTALQHELGIDTKWMSGDDIRKWLNMMNLDDILAGTFNPNDGIVDPNSVVMGYISAASKLGVKSITEVEVTNIISEKGEITGVATTKGNIATRTVINAAGPWAGLIGKMAGVEIPITPIRRQIITTTPIPDLPDDFPFVIDFSKSLYFHKEGEGILTGMSNHEETPGFNQSVDTEWELTHLEAAINRLPLLGNVGLVSHWAGLYEVTPDAHPIFGKTPVKGFYLCAGFSGHGFMHGPIAGKLISEIIIDGKATSLDISMLDLQRFSEGRTIQEYNVV